MTFFNTTLISNQQTTLKKFKVTCIGIDANIIFNIQAEEYDEGDNLTSFTNQEGEEVLTVTTRNLISIEVVR